MITEDQLEQLCLDWFQSIGYETVSGYDIAPDGTSPERSDYRQIILFDRLLNRLQIINPHIPVVVLEQVAQQIAKPETPTLIKNNKTFHQFLLEGVKIDYQVDGEDKTDYVQLLDFANVDHNRAIESAQVIEELIKMAKEMEADAEQAEKLGLNNDEIAFYRALIQNESAVKELGDHNLRELAKHVTTQLRRSTTVDWQVRDSVRAKLRNLVRRALRKWKYPPDQADEAIELCLKQAEVLSQSWSSVG